MGEYNLCTTNKKVILGQFFTKDSIWLRPQITEFIKQTGCSVAYDPFAGEGHLLDAIVKYVGFEKIIGLDIDNSLKWKVNDSLKNIPSVDDSVIITNPPYLSNYSAKRKKIDDSVSEYFANSDYDDVYLIALEKMLSAQKNVVAIIPETFINSNFKQKNMLHSITVLEDNPFDDTDAPVVVACFDGIKKNLYEISVYRNDDYVSSLGSIEDVRIKPSKDIPIVFNDINGWLAVRCVDTTDPKNMIRFDYREKIDYNWDEGIKVSSRLLTLIKIDIPESKKNMFINECNSILNKIREESSDLILSPFKGNMKNGRRRRRLDYSICRAIMEKAYKKTVCGIDKNNKQTKLF